MIMSARLMGAWQRGKKTEGGSHVNVILPLIIDLQIMVKSINSFRGQIVSSSSGSMALAMAMAVQHGER